MAEQNQQAQEAPVFQIQRVYLKDASLEQPNSPEIFLENAQPTIDVAVKVAVDVLSDGVYEVGVTATATAKIGEKTLYLVEAKQAGIMEVRNIPAEQLDPILGIAGPNIVYPYLRANVADLITRAGFPALHLSELNFEELYVRRQQEMEQMRQQQEQGVQQIKQ